MLTQLNEIVDGLELRGEGTIRAYQTMLKNVNQFEEIQGTSIRGWNTEIIEEFISKYYTGKSLQTLWGIRQRMTKILRLVDNNISFDLKQDELSNEDFNLPTPREIYELVSKLQNDQEQALIILTYIGLYDSKFETIRNLREEQVHINERVIELDNGIKVDLTGAVANILKGAMRQEEGVINTHESHCIIKTFRYNLKTGYLIRGRESSRGKDVVAEISCRTKFKSLREFIGYDAIEPIKVKNSGLLFRLLLEEEKMGRKMTVVELREWLSQHCTGAAVYKFIKQKELWEEVFMEERVFGQYFI